MIDLVYRSVQVLLNKNGQGVITPDRFNTLAEAAQNNIYSMLAYDMRKSITRKNQGYGSISLSQIKTAYDRFLVTSTLVKDATQGFIRPTDLMSLDAMYVSESERYIDIVDGAKLRTFKKSVDAMFPIGAEVGDKIVVYPDTIESVELSYHRKPKRPHWTYIKMAYDDISTTMEKIIFNGQDSTYQDFELPDTYTERLIEEILLMLGLHLKETEVINTAMTEKQLQDKQQTAL